MIEIRASLSPVEAAKIEFASYLIDLIREECDPTYRHLSKISGVSKTTIGRIVKDGHFPKWPTLRDLLVALDVTEEDIRTIWKRRWIDTQDVIKPRPGLRPQHRTHPNSEETGDKPVLTALGGWRKVTTALRSVAQG